MDNPEFEHLEDLPLPEKDAGGPAEQVIPVIEEELVTGSQPVKTGGIRVSKQVERLRKTFRMPAIRDVVKVSRVPLNRIIDSMPSMREEGDILVVPVVEEEIIVQKRLILKEEIHIHRSRVRTEASKSVTVNKEHAVIERVDADGRVIAAPRPGPRRPKSLLE